MAKHLGRLLTKKAASIAPKAPARTRFAPSPTGLLHLGSMRTAIYNYLLARSTGGQFLLRLEDTDQKRLVKGAEENIYKSLEWAGIDWDEGPLVGGPHGPYRQSERGEIYKQYSQLLLESKHAYRCFCSKERLTNLAESARRMYPPSTASYDRKCSHISQEESDERAARGESYIVRFKSPEILDPFVDLLHGELSITPQVNQENIRYDDFTLVKSDGLPTYHMANVVDDHLMQISHVIRGEEWLPSTPKHIALYKALGWAAPNFVHIPLLTSKGGKKLSKRRSDQGILDYANEVVPEAFLNFVSLLGWSPTRKTIGNKVSEVMDRDEIIRLFSLENLTKGNVQVDMSKLHYFDQAHFKGQLSHPEKRAGLVDRCFETMKNSRFPLSKDETARVLQILSKHVVGFQDFAAKVTVLLTSPVLERPPQGHDIEIIRDAIAKLSSIESPMLSEAEAKAVLDLPYEKKHIFQSLRYALLGSVPGISIAEALLILPRAESLNRLNAAICT